MIVEKPSWLRHEGLQIFSIDIQPTGLRCATAGGDHKVRIWDMKCLSTKETDSGATSSKLLATLRDHFGSVNCVRWAKSGRLIASGSDDQIVLIHERRPGSGTTEFGSGEPPDVENWKVLMTLRGHTADVVDLCWSPDDSLLGSCSLDNTVHIWNMTSGLHVAVLKGHTSLVKGVAWDPIGSFLASQSDDKSVIIWRTSDWSLVNRIEGHWDKSVGSTFFRRLGWSPCGHFITTTNGFQNPRHSAPVLERGDWTASFDFLGHNAPVVAVRFNHSLFCKQPLRGQSEVTVLKDDMGAQAAVQSNGDLKSMSKKLAPYNVIAMGSQDCSITVWTTTSPRPVFVGKHFFTQSVVDLSWSPDGYALFCCSLDGTVAAFHFEVKELGYKLSEPDMDELKRNRYGDVQGLQTALAESPAQLLLEAVACKQLGSTECGTSEQTALGGKTGTGDVINSQVIPPDGTVVPDTGVGNGVFSNVSVKASQPRISSPVKQREYRRPDGRRRIIPEPVGPQLRDENAANGLYHGRIEFHESPTSGQKQDVQSLINNDVTVGAGVKVGKRNTSSDHDVGNPLTRHSNGMIGHSRSDVKASANFVSSVVVSLADATQVGLPEEFVTSVDQNVKSVLFISVYDKGDVESTPPICLEAKPLALAVGGTTSAGGKADTPQTEVVCSRAGEVQWRDRLTAKVTTLAGNTNFWAIGCDNGSLQVYTKSGRRALPCMLLGSIPAFLDCDEGWKLLLLTRHGSLYLWDLIKPTCILRESLAPLVSLSEDHSGKGQIKIVSARLSRSGAPIVVLGNRNAFLFHLNMRCWLRVADDCFPASSFLSSLPGGISVGEGELAKLQAESADAAARGFKWNRKLGEDKCSTRAHLESQMASALALRSAEEYRRCLLAYTRFLARESDEFRLRELCEEFLGPPFVTEGGLRRDASISLGQIQEWEPTILGIDKNELLKKEIFPAMASNRKIQRLLNEFLDLSCEHEARQQSVHQPRSDA